MFYIETTRPEEYDYEGSQIIGIYSTKEEAKEILRLYKEITNKIYEDEEINRELNLFPRLI